MEKMGINNGKEQEKSNEYVISCAASPASPQNNTNTAKQVVYVHAINH